MQPIAVMLSHTQPLHQSDTKMADSIVFMAEEVQMINENSDVFKVPLGDMQSFLTGWQEEGFLASGMKSKAVRRIIKARVLVLA